MSNNFRSVEFWKASIMTLPENAFFELLRTVFGKIKTPFNKQLLLGDLEKFLSRPDIQKNIAGYIDHNDSRIISAVAALDEPALTDLQNFFAGEINGAELNDFVVNLEERFIIYRFIKEKQSHLALNPIFESILLPYIKDTSLLFPSLDAGKVTDDPAHMVIFDDRILAALLSFVSHNEMFFIGGAIRKRVNKEAKELFPDMIKAGLSLETIIGGLQVLGLLYGKDESLMPDYRCFSAFGGLSCRERMEYCAAGILCYWDSRSSESGRLREQSDDYEFSPWLLRAKVRNYASFIHRFLHSLDLKRLYHLTTLRKFMYILGRSDDLTINEKTLIDVCVLVGLIVQTDDQRWRKAPIKDYKDDVSIVMDSPFGFLVYPEIAYDDAIKLASASRVIEAGSTVRFELTRDSVVSAFDRGISATTIIELLQRLSHNRVDENLIFTLSDWEKRHGEVMLRSALVLTLSPEQLHLAETRPLAKLIVETLAPGIYLLPQAAEEKAIEALRKAGVTIVARRGECKAKDDAGVGDEFIGGAFHHFYPSLPDSHLPQYSDERVKTSSATTLIDDFHSILKEMHLGEEEHDELAARINRRLVLCESQLKGVVVRYEKLEARGLDYVGKALIAKQAITMQSPVEITMSGRHRQEHIFGIPKALEKTGGESILIIDPSNGEDTIRFPLGKISSLRRIKKSIFEV
jgi:hypothetical protein